MGSRTTPCIVAIAVIVSVSLTSLATAGAGVEPTVTGSSTCTPEGNQVITWVFAAQATQAPRYVGPAEMSGAAQGSVTFGTMIAPQTEITGTAAVDGDVVGRVDIVVSWRFGLGPVATSAGSLELSGCPAPVSSIDVLPSASTRPVLTSASPHFTG